MLQLVTLLAMSALAAPEAAAPAYNDPLADWSPWEKYRTTIVHPAVTVKAADLARAQENIRQHAWARAYRDGVVKAAGGWLARLTREYLSQMIPATTPGDTLFTPCPACRELGKPMHPAGQWRWSSQKPEELACVVCGTVFPNEKYPETVELHAKHGGGQTIRYCGGEPFKIFSYTGRPSFTGAIRAHKVRFMIDLVRRLAEAYALGRDPEHARAARLILLRLAEVYPGWMVHTGYGEYADLDPHVAARRILALPADELCPPPNVPDRKLFSGYWQGGRASGVGMEGVLLRRIVEAYDFVCDAQDSGQALFSEADRRKIEKDLLLEGTVLVDEQEQITKGRGGKFLLFHPASPVKVMEAESGAYSQAALYRRCVVQVEHAPGRQYLADIFRVRGGARHDYVFHGPNNDPVVDGPELVDWRSQPAVYDFTGVRGSNQSAAWRITWKISPDRQFSALWFSPPGESVLLGTGWGQRDYRNTDVGAVLPYIVRRREAAKELSAYAGVFEDYEPGRALCRNVRVLPTTDTDNTVVLAVETDRGVDYLVSSIEPRLVRVQAGDGLLETSARFAMVSIQQGQPKFSSLVEGTVLRWNGKDLKQPVQE